MASGNPFQTVGAAEEKRRAAVLVRDLGIVSKFISSDLSLRRGRHDISNVTRYGAADVAQTAYVEVGCFRDVVDKIFECESSVQLYAERQ